ncbi:hypothetical protein [Halorussus salinus]|uniref:hypothetical protein n=1 Tax=Halorussus salinus TaxID=1364935 RepID=UPI001092D95C|nr:hypothetical protein [Halorussus salinus]
MIRSELRELLERETGLLLLIAGGVLSVQIAVGALPDFVGVTVRPGLPEWAGVVVSIGQFALVGFGLGLPFVALFGLYHRLRSEAPRLAVAGGALMTLAPILFFGGLLSALLAPLPDSPSLLFLGPLPYVVGTALFGLAFLRRDGSVSSVGIPVLVFSATWILAYALGLRHGELPGWMPFVELLAVSLVAMGYLLSGNSTARNDGVPARS